MEAAISSQRTLKFYITQRRIPRNDFPYGHPLVISTTNLDFSILSQVCYLRAGDTRLHSVPNHRLNRHDLTAVPMPFHCNSKLVIWKQGIINSTLVFSSYKIFIRANKHKHFCLNIQRQIYLTGMNNLQPPGLIGCYYYSWNWEIRITAV